MKAELPYYGINQFKESEHRIKLEQIHLVAKNNVFEFPQPQGHIQ